MIGSKVCSWISRFFGVVEVCTEEQFLAMFDKDGNPKEDFKLKDLLRISDCSSITSLDGVVIGNGCVLNELSNIQTLYGCDVGDHSVLSDLVNLTSLVGCTLGSFVELHEMDKIVVNPTNPTEVELEIMRKIPLGGICSTDDLTSVNKTLSEWASLLSMTDNTDDDSIYITLPSMAPYRHCGVLQLVSYLKTLSTRTPTGICGYHSGGLVRHNLKPTDVKKQEDTGPYPASAYRRHDDLL